MNTGTLTTKIKHESKTTHLFVLVLFVLSILVSGLTATPSMAAVFAVEDFGAVGDGTTDDTTAIQAAIDAAEASLGGLVQFDSSIYKITAALTVEETAVFLVGQGVDHWHDLNGPTPTKSTVLKWGGASGGTMIKMASPEGAGNQKKVGGGISHMTFNSGVTTNGTGASYGVEFLSWNGAELHHLYFYEPQVAGLRMGTVTTLGEARDPQHNRISYVFGKNYINLTGGMVLLDGDIAAGGAPASANVSLNYFEGLGMVFKDGEAFKLKNSDHNFFVNCRAFRHPTGTGFGIGLHGSNAGTGSELVARANTFIGFSGGNVIRAYSTTTYTNPSAKNVFIDIDDGNNTFYPTIEAGTTALQPLVEVLSRTNLIHYFPNEIAPVLVNASGLSGAEDMATDGRQLVGTESVRIRSRAANNIVLDRPTSMNDAVEGEWGISVIAASGGAGENFRIARTAGTGVVQLADGLATRTTSFSSSPSLTVSNADIVLVDATGANRTVTLPSVAAYGTGLSPTVQILRIDSSANTVTVQRAGSDTINGGTTYALAALAGRTFIADGTSAWYTVSDNTFLANPTYGTTVTINVALGKIQRITATNGTAFTVTNPSNSVTGDIVTVMVRNTSSGTLGVLTWGNKYKRGAAWIQPASGFSRSIEFLNDGTNFVEINRTAANVAN